MWSFLLSIPCACSHVYFLTITSRDLSYNLISSLASGAFVSLSSLQSLFVCPSSSLLSVLWLLTLLHDLIRDIMGTPKSNSSGHSSPIPFNNSMRTRSYPWLRPRSCLSFVRFKLIFCSSLLQLPVLWGNVCWFDSIVHGCSACPLFFCSECMLQSMWCTCYVHDCGRHSELRSRVSMCRFYSFFFHFRRHE